MFSSPFSGEWTTTHRPILGERDHNLPNSPFEQLELFLIRTTALLLLVHTLYVILKNTYGF
jgi:hypothetical protein